MQPFNRSWCNRHVVRARTVQTNNAAHNSKSNPERRPTTRPAPTRRVGSTFATSATAPPQKRTPPLQSQSRATNRSTTIRAVLLCAPTCVHKMQIRINRINLHTAQKIDRRPIAAKKLSDPPPVSSRRTAMCNSSRVPSINEPRNNDCGVAEICPLV